MPRMKKCKDCGRATCHRASLLSPDRVEDNEAWTIHLYEAFFFGCVPVILSDDLTVPFQAWAVGAPM